MSEKENRALKIGGCCCTPLVMKLYHLFVMKVFCIILWGFLLLFFLNAIPTANTTHNVKHHQENEIQFLFSRPLTPGWYKKNERVLWHLFIVVFLIGQCWWWIYFVHGVHVRIMCLMCLHVSVCWSFENSPITISIVLMIPAKWRMI